MWLPTKAQVDAASRHAISIAGTAIVIFGLQAKGVTIEQITSVIQSLGGVVNDGVVLIGAIAPLYALLKASHSASPANQAAAVGANPATIVQPAPGGTATVTITDPAMASAALDAQKKAA